MGINSDHTLCRKPTVVNYAQQYCATQLSLTINATTFATTGKDATRAKLCLLCVSIQIEYLWACWVYQQNEINQAMRSTRMVIIPSPIAPTSVYGLATKTDMITYFNCNKSNNNLLETLCMFTWHRLLEKLEHILKNLTMKLANGSMRPESNRPRLECSGDWFAGGSPGSCARHHIMVGDQESSKRVSNVLTLHLKSPAYPKYLLQQM